MRQHVALAAPIDAATAALKDWLAITGTRDEALLGDCLQAALALCERFTGLFALPVTATERIAASGQWTPALTRPVTAVGDIAAIGADGNRRVLDAATCETAIDGDGTASLRLVSSIAEPWLEVRLEAGLAAGWDDLDPALRHGILRYAAHQYRERDNPAAASDLPAAVAALWRPFRRVRL